MAYRIFRSVALLLAGFLPALAHAAPVDPTIEGAKQCTRLLPRYERQYGIPVHLLAAIASTESGRWHDGLRILLPWPWTINADGKSYYYGSKGEAVLAARNMQADGAKNIDVGCMQVSIKQHPHAFANMDEAFDPEHNVAYASSFLRSLYDEQHSWHAAAAAYHSKTPAHGEPYVNLVYDHWNTILDRIRAARLSVVRPAEAATAESTPRKADGLLMRPRENLTVAQAPAVAVQPAEAVVPPVVVQSPRAKLAEAQNLNAMAPAAGVPANTTKVVRISDTPAPPPPGPHFIFND